MMCYCTPEIRAVFCGKGDCIPKRADNRIECYKEAMLALVRGNSNWAMTVTDEQEKLIETMVRRAEAV